MRIEDIVWWATGSSHAVATVVDSFLTLRRHEGLMMIGFEAPKMYEFVSRRSIVYVYSIAYNDGPSKSLRTARSSVTLYPASNHLDPKTVARKLKGSKQQNAANNQGRIQQRLYRMQRSLACEPKSMSEQVMYARTGMYQGEPPRPAAKARYQVRLAPPSIQL